MKARNQTELSPPAASPQNFSSRTAVESPELETVRIPVVTGDRSVAVIGDSNDAIRPFRYSAPEAELTELRRRINATRWPEKETVTDATQGVQLVFIQALARYWATDY